MYNIHRVNASDRTYKEFRNGRSSNTSKKRTFFLIYIATTIL